MGTRECYILRINMDLLSSRLRRLPDSLEKKAYAFRSNAKDVIVWVFRSWSASKEFRFFSKLLATRVAHARAPRNKRPIWTELLF